MKCRSERFAVTDEERFSERDHGCNAHTSVAVGMWRSARYLCLACSSQMCSSAMYSASSAYSCTQHALCPGHCPPLGGALCQALRSGGSLGCFNAARTPSLSDRGQPNRTELSTQLSLRRQLPLAACWAANCTPHGSRRPQPHSVSSEYDVVCTIISSSLNQPWRLARVISCSQSSLCTSHHCSRPPTMSTTLPAPHKRTPALRRQVHRERKVIALPLHRRPLLFH